MLGGVRTSAPAAGARDLFRCNRFSLQRSRSAPAHRVAPRVRATNAPSGTLSNAHRCIRLARPSSRSALQDQVHRGRARYRAALCLRPFFGEGFRGGATSFEAGPVTGGERRHLVEEEQLGVAVAPETASLPPLEAQHAADPLRRGPATLRPRVRSSR